MKHSRFLHCVSPGILGLFCLFSGCENTDDRAYIQAANARMILASAAATGSYSQRFHHQPGLSNDRSGVWTAEKTRTVLPGRFNPPLILSVEHVVWPFIARPLPHDQFVWLAFVITDHGKVSHPEIIRSTDHRFDTPALETIVEWKFRPATYQDHPVNSAVVLPFVFKARDKF